MAEPKFRIGDVVVYNEEGYSNGNVTIGVVLGPGDYKGWTLVYWFYDEQGAPYYQLWTSTTNSYQTSLLIPYQTAKDQWSKSEV